jgi:uncharacterized membrane protein YfcA
VREVLFGVLGGTLIGATGVGSGSLLTPLLIMAGYKPSVAVSTGLATLIVSKLTGAIAHHSLGNWPGRYGWIVVGGGVLGVMAIGFATAGGFSPSELFVRRAVAVSLFASSVAVWIRPGSPKRAEDGDGVAARPDVRALFLSGAITGGFVMLTSAGSGSLLVPLLLTVTAWGVPQLAATSNVFGWVAALLSLALHAGLGAFDTRLFLLVLLGLIPGVIAGVGVSPWIRRRAFTPVLSIFTLYLGFRLI